MNFFLSYGMIAIFAWLVFSRATENMDYPYKAFSKNTTVMVLSVIWPITIILMFLVLLLDIQPPRQ